MNSCVDALNAVQPLFQYGSYYCESCQSRWIGIKNTHVCASSIEERQERWLASREPVISQYLASLEPQSTEQKEQYESCVKDYLNGVHRQLFDALMQTKGEQSKDVQARRVVEILLSQRKG